MIETPSTPPTGPTPRNERPLDPPTIPLATASLTVLDTAQKLYDDLMLAQHQAVKCYDDAQRSACATIRKYLEAAENLYESLGNRVSSDTMTRLGYAAAIAGGIGVPMPTLSELSTRASELTFPGHGLPSLPAPAPEWHAPAIARVVEVPAPGGLLGVPEVRSQPCITLIPLLPTDSTTERADKNRLNASLIAHGAAQTPPLGICPVGVNSNLVGVLPIDNQTVVQVTGGGGDDTNTIDPWQVFNPPPPPPPPPPNCPLPITVSGGNTISVQPCDPVAPIINVPACPPPVVNVTVNTGEGQGGAGGVDEFCPPGYEYVLLADDTLPSGVAGERSPDTNQEIKPKFQCNPSPFASPKPSPAEDWGTDKLVQFLEQLSLAMQDVTTEKGCKRIADLLKTSNNVMAGLWEWLTGTKDGQGWVAGGALPDAVATVPGLFRPLVETIVRALLVGLRGQINAAKTLSGCEAPIFLPVLLTRALVGALETWAGTPLPEAHERLNQVAGQMCAAGIPTVGEADNALILNQIGIDTWRCWVRANGVRDDTQLVSVNAKFVRPNPDQMIVAGLKFGRTKQQIRQTLLRAGVQNDQDAIDFQKLAEYTPGPSDLVQFMTRDVFDQDVVDKYGYDKDFDQKYVGKAKEWAYAQGMTEDQFKYYWRAHWHLPSATQAYEMMHRLRPAEVNADVQTTEDDVLTLLKINDMPEYWARRLMAISYHPLTRVDIRRSFFIGTLSETELRSALMDLGYDSARTQLMIVFWTREKILWALNQPITRLWIRGEVTKDDMIFEIADYDFTVAALDQFLKIAKSRRKQYARKDIVRAIRSRVTRGLTDWIVAQKELVQLGFDAEQAAEMAQGWEKVRTARGKYLTGAQLCKMFDKGIISLAQYTELLLRQGFLQEDVQRIIKLCQGSNDAAATKKKEQQQKKDESEEKKAEQEETRKKRVSNIEAGRAAREARNLSVAEERVQRTLTSIMGTATKQFGGMPQDWSNQINAVFGHLAGTKNYTRQGAANLAKEVIEDLIQREVKDWASIALAFADTMPAMPDRPHIPPLEKPEGGNGDGHQGVV